MSSSSRILVCLFLVLLTTSLQHTAATFESSPSVDKGPWGCDPGPCQTKCCLCTVVRSRPVCGKCCPEDDETQPGGLPFSPKAAPIKLDV